MNLTERELRIKICETLSLISEGDDRIVIASPFTFEDGDSLNVILKRNKNDWYLTDEGHTFMHLSYDNIEFDKGTRKEILENILKSHYIKNDEGELKIQVREDFIGEAFFTFIQGLSKITDLSMLKRERIKSLFLEEFKEFLKSLLGNKIIFDYINREKDAAGMYKVDCYVPAERPVFIFGIPTDNKCRDTTITLLTFERWQSKFTSIVIFEDMSRISRGVRSRLTDVSDRSFSNLEAAKERMPDYLRKIEAIS